VSDIAAANAVIRDLYDALGRRIQAAREERGVTQQQLADAAGLTRTSITNVEAGRQRTPLHVLVAISQALDVPLLALLGDADLPQLAAPVPPDVDRLRGQLVALREQLDVTLRALDGPGPGRPRSAR
jgi:transcriptional regulator with XRE-family HTH domain